MEDPREHGTQPLDALMETWGVTNHELVETSTEQLNHKQVQKARKGRQLTLAMMQKVCRALNITIWNRLNKEQKETYFEYMHRHLHSYILRLNLRSVRNDPDGWATTSHKLGDKLRALRNRMGISQRALAKKLGVTQGTYLSWETNKRKPTSRAKNQLIEFFGGELA